MQCAIWQRQYTIHISCKNTKEVTKKQTKKTNKKTFVCFCFSLFFFFLLLLVSLVMHHLHKMYLSIFACHTTLDRVTFDWKFFAVSFLFCCSFHFFVLYLWFAIVRVNKMKTKHCTNQFVETDVREFKAMSKVKLIKKIIRKH